MEKTQADITKNNITILKLSKLSKNEFPTIRDALSLQVQCLEGARQVRSLALADLSV